MIIDCRTCVARHVACDDCVVQVLLNSPPATRRHPGRSPVDEPAVELDEVERAALDRLAAAGLVPPLRLVRPVTEPGSARDIA